MPRVIPPDEQRLMGETPEIRALEYELRRYPPLHTHIRRVLEQGAERFDREGLQDSTDLLGDRAFNAISALLGAWDADAEFRLALARGLLESVPVLWPEDLLTTARGLPLPAHIVSPDVMPYPAMWWRLAMSHGDEGELTSMLVVDDVPNESITAVVFGHPGPSGEIRHSGTLSIPYRSRWPEDFEAESNSEVVLQMLAFMNSRFVESDGELLPRAERRRITHAGLTEPGLDADHRVHVIRLRSPEPQPAEAGTGTEREWAHRWFVRGHYRAQWHPSIRAHRVRWIAAYVKGPSDKPIALPAVEIRQ